MKYFTSSSKIKTLRNNIGEPDVIQIRRTFQTKENALFWEERVLRRCRVLKDEKWLNGNIGGKKFFNYGAPRSDECRKKISERRKHYLSNLTDEERETLAQRSRDAGIKGARKIGDKAKERFSDPEFYKKHLDSHNTDEYKTNLSNKMLEAFQKEDVINKHFVAVNTEEYKQLQRNLSKKRWEKEGYRDRVSNSMKQVCSSPEYRELMSKRAKDSEEKRLLTRLANLQKEKQNETQIV